MRLALIHERSPMVPIPRRSRFRVASDFLAKRPLHRRDIAPLLLIVHGSNPEMIGTIPVDFHDGRDGELLIAYLGRRACCTGGRFLVVSGGEPLADMADLHRSLIAAPCGLERGRHFEFIRNCPSLQRALRWSDLRRRGLDSRWAIREALVEEREGE